jgi:folylpolyglutamate synthase/dihydropteroate synthase
VVTEVAEHPSVEQALPNAGRSTPPDGVIVVTGSIFVVGEAMQALHLEG